jgi:hypothetical protein
MVIFHEDGGIMILRIFGTISLHSVTIRKTILKMELALSSETLVSYHIHYTVSQPKRSLRPEDGGSIVLRSVAILPYHYTLSHPKRPLHPEDEVSMTLQNFGIFISLHGFTTQKTNSL